MIQNVGYFEFVSDGSYQTRNPKLGWRGKVWHDWLNLESGIGRDQPGLVKNAWGHAFFEYGEPQTIVT